MYVPLIIGCTSTSEIVCTVYYNYKLIQLECAVKFPPPPQLSGQVDTELSRQRIAEFEKLHPSPRMGRRRRRLDVNRYERRKRIFARTNRISPIFFFLFFAINFIRFPSHLFSSISFLLYDIFTFSLSLSLSRSSSFFNIFQLIDVG